MPEIKYVDRPDLAETFIDRVGTAEFSGHTIRLELSVSRSEMSGMSAGTQKEPSRRVVPVARLVLTVDAAISLQQGLTMMLKSLSQQGLIDASAVPTPSPTKQ